MGWLVVVFVATGYFGEIQVYFIYNTRRVNFFLIILITALEALIAATVVGVAFFTFAQTAGSQYPSNWMGDIWSQMGGIVSGATPTSASQNPLLLYFGVLFAVLIDVTNAGVGGLAYYVADEIGKPVALEAADPLLQSSAVQKTWSNGTAYESVLKTFTDEECKVVEVLAVHEGKYVQK